MLPEGEESRNVTATASGRAMSFTDSPQTPNTRQLNDCAASHLTPRLLGLNLVTIETQTVVGQITHLPWFKIRSESSNDVNKSVAWLLIVYPCFLTDQDTGWPWAAEVWAEWVTYRGGRGWRWGEGQPHMLWKGFNVNNWIIRSLCRTKPCGPWSCCRACCWLYKQQSLEASGRRKHVAWVVLSMWVGQRTVHFGDSWDLLYYS